MDYVLNGNDSQSSAGAITRGCEADCKTAPVRKPFHRKANAGGIDRAAPEAADHSADIQHRQCLGIGIYDPANCDRNSAERDHELRSTRAKFVYDPTGNRREPSL